MRRLPSTGSSLLVRTDFTDDAAWRTLLDHVARETADGFRAYVVPVDDRTYDGAGWSDLKSALPDRDTSVLFIADRIAQLADSKPVLVVDVLDDREPFRCETEWLWSVDNNLNIANMDWEEFTDYLVDGVFRGFPSE